MNQVPEKLINFRVYENGVDLLGLADVQLPSLEYMSETVKGAGVAGEVDSLTIGHFSKMTVQFNWRQITKPLIGLAKPIAHQLDIRGAQQVYNASTGEYKVVPIKVVVKATPKKVELGKLNVGATTDSSTEMEVVYIKISIDGVNVLEIDKFNYICNINGTDSLEAVRLALGLI